jgi:tetratricopeptide (TPR) repeat protein
MSCRSKNRLGRLIFFASAGACLLALAREPQEQYAHLAIHAGHAGCHVELDDQVLGATDATGTLLAKEVEPGDHYLHVRCPGEEETSYFLSPRPGEQLEVGSASATHAAPGAVPPRGTPLPEGEGKIQLRRLVQEAVQLRAQGRLGEAAEKIRAALKLDAENSDLHRELGITFLLGKDWKRARVEMLEAIRHDPGDADAHNGLGYAREKLGDLEGALKEYRQATHLDPEDPTYRTHYFDALSRLSAQKAKKR